MATFPAFGIGRRTVGRRILVLVRLDPEVATRLLPDGAAPRLHRGSAFCELCYTRLAGRPPRWLPRQLGTRSDHLTYRIPVEFDSGGSGAWVLRRATSSWLEARCGEKLLKGSYGRSEFRFEEGPFGLSLDVRGPRGEELYLQAETTRALPHSVFSGPREVETFLRADTGVKPHDPFAPEADQLDLGAGCFAPEPLALFEIRSTYLRDERLFPRGSAQADSAWRLVSTRLERVERSSTRLESLLDRADSSPALPAL